MISEMYKNKILASTSGKRALIGTFFTTKELADAYIRKQRRQFITNLISVSIKGGLMVIDKSQLNGWSDMIIK